MIANEMYQQVMIRIEGIADSEHPFRFEAFRQARNHQITGYIKTLDPESLQIGIQGNPEEVNQFIGWCRGFFESAEIFISYPVESQAIRHSEFFIMD